MLAVFFACHRFVTHVTGFATHFAAELASAHWLAAGGMLSVPLFFIFGSMISALLVDRRVLEGKKANYSFVFLFMAILLGSVVLLGGLGAFGKFGEPVDIVSDYMLLALLVLCSGIQNAVITSASGAVIRTTHLTGVTTDLGIGLVRILSHLKQKLPSHQETRALYLRLGIIFGFILGGLASTLLFLNYHYWGFVIPLVVSLSVWFRVRAVEKH